MFRIQLIICLIITCAMSQLDKCSFECSLKVRRSINHCSNEDGRFDCVINELNDISCQKCLCLGIPSQNQQELCFKTDDLTKYIYSIRFDSILTKFKDSTNLKEILSSEQKEAIIDLNESLLSCPPKIFQNCQSQAKFAIPFCSLTPTVDCIMMLIGEECRNCICGVLNCENGLSFQKILEFMEQKENIPSLLGQLTKFFESNQEKIKQTTEIVTSTENKLYTIPVYLWSIRNDVRSRLVKEYENVSQFAFEKYCEGVIAKTKMTCLSGRNSKPNQGYFNCIKSLISESSCQELICQKQKELC